MCNPRLAVGVPHGPIFDKGGKAMAEWILWLDQVGKDDIPLVGGKGANLGEMFRAGFPVPRAFAISARAYQRQVAGTAIGDGLTRLLAEKDRDYERLSAAVKALFLEALILPEIREEIRTAYRLLGKGVRVAVRSSATAEDLPEASFAGQQETFLGVHGEEELLQAVRECWASLWGPRAIHYRERHRFPHLAVALSVVVQEMVPADVAGVMFTVNPITGEAGEMVITASYGLGEAVVSGLVTPDTYTVKKDGTAITRREIVRKEVMVVQRDQGSAVVPVPAGQQDLPCLTDEKVREIARAGAKVEAHYGSPQDVEWAVADGRVYILQSRPITTLNKTAGAAKLPGLEEEVYGWVSLKRVPRWARLRFIPLFVDHFPEPLRPFDIYTSLGPALAGVRRVVGEVGISLPEDVALPHRSGLVLFNLPIPPIPRTLLRVPLAWLRLKPWARYDPLREWKEIDEPYLRPLLRAAGTPEPEKSSPREWLGRIRDLTEVIEELMYRRFRKYMVAGVLAQRRLGTLLRKIDPEHAEGLETSLVQGLGYKTALINRDLKALARAAAADPAVKEILAGGKFGELDTALKADLRCAQFLSRFDQFLEENGCRCALGMEPQPSYPAWRDEPEGVLSIIGAMANNPAGIADDEGEKEREYLQTRAEIKRRLGDENLVREFEWALDTTRGFWIAREGTLYLYEECVALSRDYAEELASFLVAEGKLGQARELAKLAAERHLVWNRMKSGWSQLGKEGPTGAAVRVIHGPQEFHKLKPGDILVCPGTNPAWTPLFTIAAAVVTDSGGVLSHAAIVAREYGIPAVMGCGQAARVLSDDDRVEVDGTAGRVRRLRREG